MAELGLINAEGAWLSAEQIRRMEELPPPVAHVYPDQKVRTARSGCDLGSTGGLSFVWSDTLIEPASINVWVEQE